jgi:hypothetical protein
MPTFMMLAATSKSILAQTMAATTTTTAMIVSQHLHLHLHLHLHAPPGPSPAPAPITYDPYEDASLYGDGGYQQEYSGSNYGGSSNDSMFDADMLSQITNIRGTTPPQTNWVGIIRKKQ